MVEPTLFSMHPTRGCCRSGKRAGVGLRSRCRKTPSGDSGGCSSGLRPQDAGRHGGVLNVLSGAALRIWTKAQLNTSDVKTMGERARWPHPRWHPIDIPERHNRGDKPPSRQTITGAGGPVEDSVRALPDPRSSGHIPRAQISKPQTSDLRPQTSATHRAWATLWEI